MEFKEIVMKRYAAKKFDGKKIPENKISELLEFIRFSASSFNIQPWKIKIITDQETKDKLQAVSWNQPQVGTSSHVLVFCADTDVEKNIDKLEKMMPDAKQYVQLMRGFAEGLTGEARLTWSQKQCYIALGNALNGAKALGFDSCPMEGFNPAEYKRILKLPENLHATVVCPIGYGADVQGQKHRFRKEEVFF
jgi:nitroreductase